MQRFPHRLLLLPLSCAAAATPAQPLPGGFAFGMTASDLQQAQAAVKRVPRPTRLAGGLVGSWSAEPIDVAGVALVPTLYLAAGGQLQRVEYLARDGGPAAFAALLAWAREAWGAELASNAPEGAYASWSGDAIDAYLQLADGQVRLVAKRPLRKDAGEL